MQIFMLAQKCKLSISEFLPKFIFLLEQQNKIRLDLEGSERLLLKHVTPMIYLYKDS